MEDIKKYLKIVESRGVLGAEDGGLTLFINDENIELGKTPEEVAEKLKGIEDLDLDDLFASSSVDFADEYGFQNEDDAHELFDKAIALMVPKPDDQADEKPEDRPATSDDIAKINKGEEIEEGVYANYVTYIGPNGKELGTEDYDGELEPDMMAQMASDEECKMLCDKHNIDYNDIVGCLKFDDGEATMQDGTELPDGTIAFYGGKEGTPELRMMGEEAISEATLGAVHGSLKTSYQPLDNVKLVVKHSKPVNEEVRGARSRNISKIFIQANEERFLFPSKNLQGARAMARHIYNGGVMHDSIGESIVQMCKDFGTLKEFIRYVNKKGLINEDNQEYVTLARQQMDNIRTAFKRVAGVKTYSKAVESITDESNIDIVTEVNLEDHFTETHFDDKVGNAHETLSKLVNRKNAF